MTHPPARGVASLKGCGTTLGRTPEEGRTVDVGGWGMWGRGGLGEMSG